MVQYTTWIEKAIYKIIPAKVKASWCTAWVGGVFTEHNINYANQKRISCIQCIHLSHMGYWYIKHIQLVPLRANKVLTDT